MVREKLNTVSEIILILNIFILIIFILVLYHWANKMIYSVDYIKLQV